MSLRIRHFIAHNGERFSQIYDTDADGFPMFYPVAFITRAIRDVDTHETQLVYLEAIKRVYQWGALNGIDLESRLHQRAYLTQPEIDSLANHLHSRVDGQGDLAAAKYNTLLAYAATYIKWLGVELVTDKTDINTTKAIENQDKAIRDKKRRRTGSKSARIQELIAKHLSDDAREQLLNMFENPYQQTYHQTGRATRLRNIVMLRVPYETGMRLGELLGLKLKHFVESGGRGHASLIIERNHHDEFDTRVKQPVAKTLGRTVPISPELERLLLEYIELRAEVPNVGFDDEDFIFVNHRAGPGQGEPVSVSTFYSALADLKRLYPVLADFHIHMLRHDWNYRFSQKADIRGMTEQEEIETRCRLMGWEAGSKMAQHYNKRHIQQKATEIGLLIANDTQRPAKG